MSAAQCDKLLFKEAKEKASFRRELSDSLKQSNDNFLKVIYMSNQATQNQNAYFPNNLPNVHPIIPQNISQNIFFSRPDSYASYAEWLNES